MPPTEKTEWKDPELVARARGAPIALLLILSAAGCLPLPPTGRQDDRPATMAHKPTPTRTAHDATGLGPEVPAASATRALVVEVVDGDTIRVSVDGSIHRVRYIGINAPERQEPLGPAATAANRELVAGGIVYVERDVSETDEFGRLLRYVYLPDGTFVNGDMVRRGLAEARAYPPDVGLQTVLDALEEEAQEAGRGMWELAATSAPPGEPGLRILAVDAEAEVVDLINGGDDTLDLTGWTLFSERGNQVCRLAGELEPGESLRVWSLARDGYRGGFNCRFEEPIWNNHEPDRALLYAPDGTLVDSHP